MMKTKKTTTKWLIAIFTAILLKGCFDPFAMAKAKDYHPWVSSDTLRTNPPGPAYPDQAMGK